MSGASIGSSEQGDSMSNSSSNTSNYRHPMSRVISSRPLGPMRVPARALGWFSIALGLAELAMPRRMAHLAGAPNLPLFTRACGLREIGTGIGILTARDPAPWIWGRVAGDALDVATVGAGLVTAGRPMRTLGSLALLLGVTYIDMRVAQAAPLSTMRARQSLRDYSGRSGFPRSPDAMRGIAQRPSSKMAAPLGAPSQAEDSRNALTSAVAGATS
jgi:hypothetical protein